MLGGPASDQGRLSLSDVSVKMIVLAGNNPYGVYVFANGSRDVSIAEDFTANGLDTSASLVVHKALGAADYTPVW